MRKDKVDIECIAPLEVYINFSENIYLDRFCKYWDTKVKLKQGGGRNGEKTSRRVKWWSSYKTSVQPKKEEHVRG
jgi:hypothetical protein